jgi:hypothetical protein
MRVMKSRTISPLVTVACSAVGLGAVAGCGVEEGTGRSAAGTENRARQVAAAWDGSSAADAWRAGYFPMGEAVQLPRGGLHGKADEQAFRRQVFVLRDASLVLLADKAVELGASVHMPRIGCGLAGGNWSRVEPLVTERLVRRGLAVTVYDHGG